MGLSIAALLLFIVGLMLLLASYRLRQGVRPTGHVDYVEGVLEAYVPHGPLVASRLHLAGRPHGLLRLVDRGQVIPIHVVDSPAPPEGPEPAQAIEVMALCLLVEEVYSVVVPYGIVRYSDKDISAAFTPRRQGQVEEILARMHGAAGGMEFSRTHDDPSICLACPVRAICDQALA